MPEHAPARPEIRHYSERFERERGAAPFSKEPKWLEGVRAGAIARFAEQGLPTFRDEEWKYTSLTQFSKIGFAPAHGPVFGAGRAFAAPGALEQAIRDRLEGLAFHRDSLSLVFVDGRFFEALAPKGGDGASGLSIGSVADEIGAAGSKSGLAAAMPLSTDNEDGLKLLNTSFFADGAYVRVARGAAIDKIIHFVFVSTGTEGAAASFRNVIRLEEGAQARVVESYFSVAGSGGTFTSSVTQAELGPDSVLDHWKLQDESAQAYHYGELRVAQERRSSLRSLVLSVGGRLARNEVRVALGGEGAECALNGLYAARGEQHVDNLTVIDHAKPGCVSHENYRGVLDGSARGVFNGKVLVRPGAQKTLAEQSNRNLLLSPNAIAHTRPQLQIYADDVKCTHGATVGRLDDGAMFYLRSRGIGETEARLMLTAAFADELLERVGVVSVRETARAVFGGWLRG